MRYGGVGVCESASQPVFYLEGFILERSGEESCGEVAHEEGEEFKNKNV